MVIIITTDIYWVHTMSHCIKCFTTERDSWLSWFCFHLCLCSGEVKRDSSWPFLLLSCEHFPPSPTSLKPIAVHWKAPVRVEWETEDRSKWGHGSLLPNRPLGAQKKSASTHLKWVKIKWTLKTTWIRHGLSKLSPSCNTSLLGVWHQPCLELILTFSQS